MMLVLCCLDSERRLWRLRQGTQMATYAGYIDESYNEDIGYKADSNDGDAEESSW